MATCPDCGDNKITVEMIKGGILVCRECSIERGKKHLANAQARRASNQTNKLKAKGPKPVPEEDFHGVCNGGCGKRVDGEYTCHDCRNKSTKELFKVRLDEGEL
jgi:rubredoxin